MGVSYLEHFLDDFITWGPPLTEECQHNLSLLMALCKELDVPLAWDKLDGPSTTLIFLGILLDTIKLELRLPAEKLQRLQAMLEKWKVYKHCTKKDLESLVGYLQDASKVIRPGRTFTRWLIDLLKANHTRPSTSHIRLNVQARSDILWWHTFIQHWNGLSMMTNARVQNPDTCIHSDTSGSWGCGAYWEESWFQLQWCTDTSAYNITIKELLPIVIATCIWGDRWEGKSVRCRCDNEAVVHIINSGTSRDPTVMNLMRCLHFIAARFNILISASHLAGIKNTLADALSRNNSSLFLHCCPQAHKLPSPIPPALMDLLIHSPVDWTSPCWTAMFNSIFRPQWLAAPSDPMPPVHDATAPSAPSTKLNLTPQTRTPSASLWPSWESKRHYLSGIRFFHIMHSYPNPFASDLPKLQYVLRGVKLEEAKTGQPQQSRLPVTPQILTRIHTILIQNPTDFDNIMLWAAFLVSASFAQAKSLFQVRQHMTHPLTLISLTSP